MKHNNERFLEQCLSSRYTKHPDGFRIAVWSLLLIGMLLAGCTRPTPEAALTVTVDATQVRQTVEVRLTESSLQTQQASASSPGTPSPSPALVRTASPTPLRTQPTPTLGLTLLCDKAAPGNPIDVTIEDGTLMQPGQRFTKTWRLMNAGTCTWTRSYKAIWFYGEKFGETLTVPITGDVLPGSSVEITVDMIAPITPGSYRSNWKLQNSSGEFFGIGPDAAAPFWVQITVVRPTPTATTTAPTPTVTTTAGETTPTLAVTHEVQATGPAVLALGASIDLDALTVNPPEGADLAYSMDDASMHWLNPQRGAQIGVYGSSKPDWIACEAAGKSIAPIALESLTPGTYLCFHTAESRYGWLLYDNINTGDNSLETQALTWK